MVNTHSVPAIDDRLSNTTIARQAGVLIEAVQMWGASQKSFPLQATLNTGATNVRCTASTAYENSRLKN